MGNLFKVSKNILLRIARKRSSILMHIVVPAVVIMGISMLFSYGGDGVYRAAVVDLSQSASSQYLLDEIEATGKFAVVNIEENQADEHITEGISSFVLIIPENFENMILSGEAPKVRMMSLKESEGAAWMRVSLNLQIGNLADAAFGADYNADSYYGIINSLENSQVKLSTDLVDDSSNDIYATQPLIGMYLMFVLMSSSSVAFLILEEKKRGTFARIGTAPIRPRTYTMANVLSNMVILTLQLILVVVLIKFVVGMDFMISDITLLIILFCYILCCVGLGVLIASATQKQGRASAIFYLILTPSCMISGCFWPIEFMPDVLAKASLITPQRWALNAISVAQRGENITISLLILIAYAALLFIGAAYFIKYKEKV
jgi:ABC-2 type transport system permease protein